MDKVPKLNPDARIRVNRGEPIQNCLDLIKNIEEFYPELWPLVTQLLELHEYDHSGYSLPIKDVIKAFRLCLIYETESVASKFFISYSALNKLLAEICAAVYFILNNETIFPVTMLNSEGLIELKQFNEMRSRMKLIETLMLTPKLRNIVDSLSSLRELVTQLKNNGTIRPYLLRIGLNYENPHNLDNNFYDFITMGSTKGGSLTLLRRVLYANWLETGVLNENLNVVEIPKAIAEIGRWLFQNEVAQNRTLNDMKLFIKYLVLKDLDNFLPKMNISDDEFQDMFPTRPLRLKKRIAPNRLIIPIETLSPTALSRIEKYFILKDGKIIIPMDWDSYFSTLGSGPLPHQFRDYVDRVVHERDRVALISDLALKLRMSPESARKVYDKSLYLLDYLFFTPIPHVRLLKLGEEGYIDLFSQSVVTKTYESYKNAIKMHRKRES